MKVFILEDSPTISILLERTLLSYNYLPFCFTSKTFDTGILEDHDFDIFILNTRLEKIDSKKICLQIRKIKNTSYIIGIATKGSWIEKVDFLNSGADDCISFPFPPEEILARIQALLRRPREIDRSSLSYGYLKIDPFKRIAYYGDRRLNLSRKEFTILEYFIRNYERGIPRTELMDQVWDYRKQIASNTIDVHITKIRKKILETKKSYYNKNENFDTEIKTVYGIGYELKDNLQKGG